MAYVQLPVGCNRVTMGSKRKFMCTTNGCNFFLIAKGLAAVYEIIEKFFRFLMYCIHSHLVCLYKGGAKLQFYLVKKIPAYFP
jgi:hypothetical protein